MFVATLSTYLVSKEIYVLEHEYYNALSLLTICVFVVKKFGPNFAKYLDKQIDEQEKQLNSGRVQEVQAHEDAIKEMETEKWRLDGQNMIFDIRKQSVLMQLEAVYRERAMQIYNEVMYLYLYLRVTLKNSKSGCSSNAYSEVINEYSRDNFVLILCSHVLNSCVFNFTSCDDDGGIAFNFT